MVLSFYEKINALVVSEEHKRKHTNLVDNIYFEFGANYTIQLIEWIRVAKSSSVSLVFSTRL